MDASLGEKERVLARQDLADKDRAYVQVEQEAGPLPLAEIGRIQQSMQALRKEMNRDLVLLGRALLDVPCPPGMQGERDSIEELMAQLEGATNMLSLRLGGIKPA